jgi:hypothetical protein
MVVGPAGVSNATANVWMPIGPGEVPGAVQARWNGSQQPR